MTLASISLARFAEELGGLHGWSNEAIDEFVNATTHEKLPREDWVRIASTWALYETELENIPGPLLFVEKSGLALAFNGKLGTVELRPTAEIAQRDADELNGYIRGSDEFDRGTRWYAVKVHVILSDSE